MNSKTLTVTQYTLEAVSNSYEELHIVVEEVSKWAREEGVAAAQGEVLAALTWLIAGGYAKAYEVHEGPSGVRETTYSPQFADKLYYYVTPKGKAVAQWLTDTAASDSG